MNATSRYLLQYAVFLLLLAGALYFWNIKAPLDRISPAAWPLLGFLALAYLGSHFFMLGANGKKPGVFVRRFMGSTTIRLFLFLGIIVTYAFFNKGTAPVFIVHFLVFYVAFTAFEVASLYRHFRKND